MWLGLTALSFDISTVELFVPLTTGGRVVVVPEEDRWDGGAQRALIRAQEVTHVQATPSGWRLLLAAGFGKVDGVRCALTGGEALPEPLAAELTAAVPRLVNVYGPTEATVWATFDELTGHEGEISIGRPLPNYTAHVLDDGMRPVPIGAPGELYLGGAGVARGYHDRPGLTAERFVPDPFGPPGARLYRTGDLAARRADGRIRFLGRDDHQVKIRGHRIELGEIEEALTRHPDVATAAVAVHRDDSGEPFLTGYVCGGAPDPADVRDFLRGELPRAMVPARFVVLERMPLSPAGKIDRRALPDPGAAAPETARHIAPRTPAEQALADIWQQVLGVAEVGVSDDFFALGGNSIKAVLVTARARERGLALTTRQLFAHPTVEALATTHTEVTTTPASDTTPFALAGLAPAELDTLLDAVGRADTEDVLPLSPLQTGLLLHTLAETADYVRTFAVDLDGAFDQDAFEEAWRYLVDRYAILRSTFHWADVPHPVQVVRRSAPPEFTRLDLSVLPEELREARLAELTEDERCTVFDLAEAPPARFLLVRLAEDRHRFVWTTHHIVFDGWSLHALFAEAFAAYRHRRDTGRLPDAPPPPPYRDYLRWLQRQGADGGTARALDEWRTELAGFTRPTPLPGSRPTGRRAAVHTERQVLPPDLLTALDRTARRHHVTVGTLVHTAWALLLARTSGERDVLFGTTLSGRFGDVPGIESMVGLLMNTLPLRLDVDPDTPPAALLRSVHQRLTGLAGREHVSLGEVQRAAEVPGGKPLFDSLVVFTDIGTGSLPAGVRPVPESEVRDTGYPLVLEAVRTDRLTLELGCDRSRYDESTARRLLAQTARLLTGLTEDHDRAAGLPMLSAEEYGLVVRDWNATVAGFPAERTLHSLIEEQAARTPDALAVRCGAEGLTYAELNSRANRVAHRLRHLGVGSGSLVALCTERSLEHVIGVVAILKASAAFVPVDPEHPARRQAYILADARAQAVLTQRRLVESLPDGAETAVPVLALDDPALWQDEPDHDPAPVALPADLCSLYYTSGSTGRPKGVASTHEGWVNRMWWMQRRHGLRPGDAVLHKTTLTFDDAAVEILWPLITGGQVVLLPPGAHRDAHEIADAVIRHGVVHVQFVPSVLEVFLDVLTPERAAAMTRLRSVLTSGEALRPVLVRRFRELFGDRVSLDNTWGATEVSIDSTFHVCGEADAAAENGAVSLGRPFDNNTVYVLDEDMAPVPVGITGELFIGGLGLARGYHGRPALTAERFVPDPFGPPGARLYRTGDLGRWRADGTLEFGGRTDHQVKIGGVRVELGEIEDALRRAPGVKDAVVDVRTLDGVKILVGYTTGGTAPEQLRAALQAELPDAMVPNAFVALAAVPLNANGKVDRAALPDPEPDAQSAGQSYVAPRTPTEETLAGIWARVLRVGQVGVHDNFRVMGGDSILLIHTVARAREAGLPATPRMVFEHPTVAGLAAAVDAAAARGREVVVHAEQGRVTGEVPLGPIQAQYAELGPRDRFNQSLLLAVDETVRADPLRAALSALAGHHDALRLRWAREAAGWRQHLAETEDADLLTVVDAPEEEAAAVEAAHAGLDLAHGPLLRAVLLRPTRRLLLVVHHVAVDTVSWNILVEDLNTLVSGGALPAKTTSVQYWARRLAEHAASAEFRAEAEYWALPRPAVPPLPLDRADGENTEGRSRTVRVVLAAGATEALLRQAPAAHGAEPDHLMLAALARTLTEWTGGDTAAFDVERHGREALFDDVDLSRTVGWFTGVRPVVVTLRDPDDTAACVTAVREHLRTAPAGSIGHGLARHLRPGTRDVLADRPQPHVCFNYHGRRDGTGTVAGPLRPLPQALGKPVDPEQRRSHLLEIDSAVLEGQLHLVWRYAADHFAAATVEDLAERHLRRLTALVEHSTTPGAVRRPVEPFVERLFAGTPAPLLPMLRHRVPGVGIAVIADGDLRGAWGFGALGADDPTPVDARTLFQVGSISKHVTALAVLRLVQEGRLDLDTDVNRLLTTWQLPGEGGVTLRHLLSHTAGLGEQAYHGYRGDERMPTLREVLDGRPPAVTPPVRPERPPGSGYQYSSSNYTVVQQVLEDVTGQPFVPLLRSLVLAPLGMTDSDFAPDAPHRYDGPVALNHRLDGTSYPEGWHLYPESAAGGLWSTPADVARVAIEIQRAVAGGPTAFLTAESAAEMLRPVPGTPGRPRHDRQALRRAALVRSHRRCARVPLAHLGGPGPRPGPGRHVQLRCRRGLPARTAARAGRRTGGRAMVTLDEAFRRWAERTPNAVALESADTVLTYRELDERAELLARRLRRHGVRPGELVGLAARPSPRFVVTMLAVIRAGAAYVPLDLSYPADRLAHMRRDSGIRLLVTDSAEELTDGLADCEVLAADLLVDEPNGSGSPLGESVAADDLAYAIYTSGSTGLPKAVLVEHRNVLAFALGQDFVGLGPGRAMLRTSSFSFDASVLETWGVLLRGARLVFPPEDMLGTDELAQVLAARRVTDLWLSVGLFHQLVDEDPAALAGLRTVVTGGDVVSPQRVRSALAANPGLTVAHVYGPTETTVICCRHFVSAPEGVERPLPLGTPIPGVRFHVVGEHGEVLPPGQTGELWIAGETVARGYHDRPELTAERFVTEPGTADGRAYRSGDLARMRPDGVVEFLGRADRQVKVRGFRVEPGEIEAALLDVPGVRACLVVARPAPPGDKRIVAYVVPEPGARVPAAEAHRLLAGRLPRHMLPAEYMAIEALPLDANGKPDRHRLPDPVWGSGTQAVLAAPALPAVPFERI